MRQRNNSLTLRHLGMRRETRGDRRSEVGTKKAWCAWPAVAGSVWSMFPPFLTDSLEYQTKAGEKEGIDLWFVIAWRTIRWGYVPNIVSSI